MDNLVPPSHPTWSPLEREKGSLILLTQLYTRLLAQYQEDERIIHWQKYLEKHGQAYIEPDTTQSRDYMSHDEYQVNPNPAWLHDQYVSYLSEYFAQAKTISMEDILYVLPVVDLSELADKVFMSIFQKLTLPNSNDTNARIELYNKLADVCGFSAPKNSYGEPMIIGLAMRNGRGQSHRYALAFLLVSTRLNWQNLTIT